MGHDISGITKDTEVAYLRRGAFNPLNYVIYDALGAQSHNCGWSGCGTYQTFTKEEIELAIRKLSDIEELQPERKFLYDCLANLDEAGKIKIEFS